eukprot:51721_1
MNPNSTVNIDFLGQDIVRFGEALLFTGYNDLERPRIKNIHCGHHKFEKEHHDPCAYFVNYLMSFLDKIEFANNDSNDISMNSMNTIHDLAGDGICKRCALLLFIQLLNHNSIDKRTENKYHKEPKCWMFGGKGKQNIQWIMKQSNTAYQSMAAMLFCIVMAHPHICAYAFKHTHFWQNAFGIYYGLISATSQMKLGDDNEDSNLHHWLLFNALFCFSLQIIRNMQYCGRIHFEYVVKVFYPKMVEAIPLYFKNQVFLRHEQGKTSMVIIVIFFVYVHHYYIRLKAKLPNGIANTIEQFYGTLFPKGSNGQFMVLLNGEESIIRKNFFLIVEYNDWLHQKMNVFLEKTKAQKWKDIPCCNQYCQMNRNVSKLRKCSGCKLARYCSRKCQKRDWYGHKDICVKLSTLKTWNIDANQASKLMQKCSFNHLL